MPPKTCTALAVCATAMSPAKHLAMEQAMVAGSPRSMLHGGAGARAARAAAMSLAMSASIHCRPWFSAIALPNCLRCLA